MAVKPLHLVRKELGEYKKESHQVPERSQVLYQMILELKNEIKNLKMERSVSREARLVEERKRVSAIETIQQKLMRLQQLQKEQQQVVPSKILFSGKAFTQDGIGKTQSVNIVGVKPSMFCGVWLTKKGTVPRSIVTSVCKTGYIEVVFTDDPADDHEITYIVFT